MGRNPMLRDILESVLDKKANDDAKRQEPEAHLHPALQHRFLKYLLGDLEVKSQDHQLLQDFNVYVRRQDIHIEIFGRNSEGATDTGRDFYIGLLLRPNWQFIIAMKRPLGNCLDCFLLTGFSGSH